MDVVEPRSIRLRGSVRVRNRDHEGLGLLNDVAGGLGLAHEVGLDRHAANGCRTGGIRVRRRHPRLEGVAVQRGTGRVGAGAVRDGTRSGQGTDLVPVRRILEIDPRDRVGGEDDARYGGTLATPVRSGAVGSTDGGAVSSEVLMDRQGA